MKDTHTPPPAPAGTYCPLTLSHQIQKQKQPAKRQNTLLTLAWYAALIFFGWVLGAML